MTYCEQGSANKVRSTLRKSMIDSVKEGGTMAYMPPERFGKDNIPIKASDIWATGATVFELLTGDLPFGEHGGAMQKSGAEIPNISGDWSNELREIITRCLQKDPWDRPVAQQIVEWAEKRLKGEILSFETTKQQNALSFPVPDLLTKKIVWGIGGCVLGLLLSFIIAKNFMSGNPDTDRSIAKPENRMADVGDSEISIADAGDSKNSLPLEGLAEREQTANLAQPALTDKNTETQTKTAEAKQPEPAASASETSAPPPPPTWIAEYDRITGVAQAAYNRQRYETAKAEYTKALTLAVQYGDRAKQTAANRQITECNNAIEAEKEAVEKARQDRLALYNFIGRFPLGPACMVVQKKSDKRWGIIDREGNEVEAANYDQVSARLKNGYYALKNDRGWVVFDTSLKKVATGLEKLDEYQ